MCIATLLSEKRKKKRKMLEESVPVVLVPEKKKKKKPVKMGLNKKKLKAKPVEHDVPDILRDMEDEEEEPAHLENLSLASRKSVGGQKLPKGVPPAHLDNVSLHEEDRVRKWRYVYHRTVFLEKELSKEALKIDVIMELLHDAQRIKTVSRIGPYFPRLVKEFIVNLSTTIDQSSP